MENIPQLIADLALILLIAGITTLIFRRLKQPVVLGYVIAGMLVGPSITFFPTIGDPKMISTWGEIGVIILLFTIGLEFSFKKLVKVGGTGIITSFFEFIVMFAVGYLIGKEFGWSHLNSIFLGAMLTVSSTTIIAKAFDDMRLKSHLFASIVIGILIVEDLVAIMELVLLPTVAASQVFSGTELAFNLGKMLFFLIIWFVTGIYVIPTIIKKIHNWLSDETLLIVSLGLCLGMVVLAVSVGFSAALGAFIMGSILAETIEVNRIERLLRPIKNLFVAIFFVSVGLLVDPKIIMEHWMAIIVITLAVIIVKPISATIGVFVTGHPLKTAMQSGFCLCQVGEFSFIIANMGLALGLIDNFLYPIAVSVSVITTFITPYQIKAAVPIYNSFMNILPKNWRYSIESYTVGSKFVQNDSDWKLVTKKFITTYILYCTIIIGLLIIAFKYIDPMIMDAFDDAFISNLTSFWLTLFISAPFIFALIFNTKRSEAFKRLWNDNMFNRGYLTSLIFLRIITALIFLGIIILHYTQLRTGFFIITLLFLISLILFSRNILRRYNRMEQRFLKNMKLDEASKRMYSEMFQKDMHLAKFTVSADSDYIGLKLSLTGIREKYGINVVSILRGSNVIPIPKADDILFPGDVITVLGSDIQLRQFRSSVEKDIMNICDVDSVELHKLIITKHSGYVGKSIKATKLREKYNLLIAGIERDNTAIMNPASDVVFENNDVVWFVGEKKNIDKMSQQIKHL